MSVSVRRLVKDKVTFNQSSTKQNSATITTISVTARIDYILRFSKQSVLVVDDNTATYSKVASQFLSTLTNKNNTHINAAFVCASTQLNDIQMRCRLIEQLFSDTLFDPEQSLVVSILRLVKQQPQAITIVIEHAQSLSLQLKYELSQLAEVAKKTTNVINVVMFGSIESAQQVASEKSLFGNNLAIILAKSGQVVSINHKTFKKKSLFLSNPLLKRISWVLSVAVFIALLLWLTVSNYDYFKLKVNEYLLWFTQESIIKKENITEKKALKISHKEAELVVNNKNLASTEDIYQALLGNSITEPIINKKLIINTEIVKALPILPIVIESKSKPLIQVIEKKNLKLSEKKILMPLPLDASYYLAKQEGFIIQIAGFSDEYVFNQFIEEYSKLELYSYERLLNQQPFVVLTSKVYASKNEALKAINTLPKTLQERGLWVKSIDIVKKEINAPARS